MHPDDRERTIASVQRCLSDGAKTWEQRYRFRRKDGSYADVYDRGIHLYDEHQRVVRVVGGMLDLTQRNRDEEDLRLLRRAIAAMHHQNHAQRCPLGFGHDRGNIMTFTRDCHAAGIIGPGTGNLCHAAILSPPPKPSSPPRRSPADFATVFRCLHVWRYLQAFPHLACNFPLFLPPHAC